MSNKREVSKKLFDQTNLPKDAMNWHVWKRAFDLGFDIGLNEAASPERVAPESNNLCNVCGEEMPNILCSKCGNLPPKERTAVCDCPDDKYHIGKIHGLFCTICGVYLKNIADEL